MPRGQGGFPVGPLRPRPPVAELYREAIDAIQELLNRASRKPKNNKTELQLAVDRAAELWALPKFHNKYVKEVRVTYDEHLDEPLPGEPPRERSAAETNYYPTSRVALVRIGPKGLSLDGKLPFNARWLASTVYHESIHVRDQAGTMNLARFRTLGDNVNEYEAYSKELQKAASLGLTPGEINDLKREMKWYYDDLEKRIGSRMYIDKINRGVFTIEREDKIIPECDPNCTP